MRRFNTIITLIFFGLALVLEGLIAGYWNFVLQPRLRAEAQDQAKILAQSEAAILGAALAAKDPVQRREQLSDGIDHVLLLRDETSSAPYFVGVQVEVDRDAVPGSDGLLDLSRGELTTTTAFHTDVGLYDPASDELLGIASFRVSPRFFELLSRDVKRHLLFQAVAVLGLLVLTWAVLLVAWRKLEAQTSERERIERALAANARKYRRLLDSLSNYFVYSLDANGRIEFVSDAVTAVLGHTPEEFARSFESLLTDATTNIAARERVQFHEGEAGERTYEIELRGRDGEVHRLEHAEIPVLDEDGRPVGADGVARDVTPQRRLERELRAAKEEAEAASRTKSQFLANVSHEVRTPLNAVIGMTSLALKTELTPKQENYLRKAQASAKLLLEILNDILDLSKIEAGKLELQHVRFALDDVLTEIASIVGFRAGEKGLEVLFATARDVPRVVSGDPLRLGQVLLNLTNNAIKFTDKGEIVVAIDAVKKDDEHVVLRFSVKDTGIGISEGVISSLFQPFTQADASTTRQYGGTGLGLAISKRLVEMMGGSINVESTLGRGSVFTFTTTFGLAPDSATPFMVRSNLRGLPVLVVDDNETARAVFKEMLTSFSVDVTCVASGERALEQVQRAAVRGVPYKLVLVDWRMPGIDGIETVRRIRDAGFLDQQPGLILVTAYGRDEVVTAAEDAGADVFISKPVSPSTLFNAVLEALSAREPELAVVAKAERRDTRPFAADCHVLLAEDNAINREVARELLGDAGIRVTEALTGTEAVDLVAKQSFHAVLMDVQMPEMDGLEATSRIRSVPRHANLPIIAMTAHAMTGDRERFLAAGMNDYVAKPIEEVELLGVLGRWLPRAERPTTASSQSVAAADAAPAPSHPAERAALDRPGAILRLGGREELYKRLAADFRAQNGSTIDVLRAALERGDLEAVRTTAHAMRGTAGVIGADEVVAATAELEKAAARGERGHAAFDRLERALPRVFEAIDAFAPPRPAEPAAAAVASTTNGGDAIPDVDELRAALAELAGEIESNSLRARKSASDACQRWSSSRVGARLGDVEEMLRRLDFDAARERVADIAGELGSPGGAS